MLVRIVGDIAFAFAAAAILHLSRFPAVLGFESSRGSVMAG
jgi:hypothetical protein